MIRRVIIGIIIVAALIALHIHETHNPHNCIPVTITNPGDASYGGTEVSCE